MIDAQLQKLLICPHCHGELDFASQQGPLEQASLPQETELFPGVSPHKGENSIHCRLCGAQYAVAGNIPVMFSGTTNDGFGHDLYRAQLHGNFFERVFHNNRIKTLLRLITNELDIVPGARVLDVGCNTGPLLVPMRQRGYEVTGVDISPDDVQQAECYLEEHNLFPGGLSVADGTRLPFRDHSFDLVLLIDILEHTDYPDKIVLEAKRLLAPGGIVIATVPWAFHPYVRYTWLRKLLSSRTTIDEHPDAPFKLEMLQSLFPSVFEPLCFRLVFHWVCILGVYRLQATELAPRKAIAKTRTEECLLT
jgi:SAM-dependent methyltransferase